jgi:hypothetical protein
MESDWQGILFEIYLIKFGDISVASSYCGCFGNIISIVVNNNKSLRFGAYAKFDQFLAPH